MEFCPLKKKNIPTWIITIVFELRININSYPIQRMSTRSDISVYKFIHKWYNLEHNPTFLCVPIKMTHIGKLILEREIRISISAPLCHSTFLN